MESISKSVTEYNEVFLPDLQKRQQMNEEEKKKMAEENLSKFKDAKDSKDSKGEKKEESTPKDPGMIDIEKIYNEDIDDFMEKLKM